jgi:hypothetical protein
MIEAFGFTITDGAVRKERGVAAASVIEQGSFATNVQEGRLLAGKACLGQILGSRA